MTHKLIETALLKIIPQDDPKQALRLYRFFMASAIYVLAWFLTYIFFLANIMDWESVFVCLIGIPVVNVIFYIVFRTGLNLRTSDPSLTLIQICAAILIMMYGMYHANEARGLLLLIYVPILLFGSFRLHTRQFLFLSALVLLTYGIDIALLHVFNPPRVNFKIEYLQWCVLAIVLVILSFMGGHISSIRKNLSTSRAELEKTVSLIKTEVDERKKAQETMAQSIGSLKTINKVADRIYRILDYPSLTREALTAMVEYGKTATASLFEYNEDENCLILVDAVASEPAIHVRSRVLVQRLPLYKSAAGDAVREKKIIVCEDIATDPRILPATKEALLKEGRKSGLFIPLLFQDRVLGTINLVYPERLSLKDYELETLLSIGKTIGLAMANVRHIQQIKAEIQERQQTEETLRFSEEKFSKIFHSAPLLMGTNDIEKGTHLDVNEKWTEVSGFSREEAIGKTSVELGWLSRENLIQLTKKLKHHGLVESMELNFQSKNKQQVCCLYSGEVITVGGKQVLLSLMQDITEKKKIEEEKVILEERLQRSQKMEALGTLAGGVAHDLNNVLGVIVGYSELLLNEVDKLSPIRPRLTKIMNGSEKAAAIVQDLLTLARRGVSDRKVVNLNKIIIDYQNSPELEKLSSYYSNVRIKLNLESGLLNIAGSSVHLGKALINLASNAMEAMPKGGELTIKTTNQYLEEPIYGYDEVREGDYVVLSVTDTGEGIPKSDLKRIFEPFYTKKIMGRSGTGLGLAVIWGTVKDHQGYINVQSEEGKGSTFTLYFPVTREGITAEALAISISEYMGKGETILVVDDVREQRDLAAEMLKKLNYQIATVASGEEAITYITDHKVDLLVLDMIMDPGMDGLDTYKSIIQIHPKQKAIIVSGFSESDRVNAAHALGAGAYVKKPYVIEKLGMAIRKELDRIG